MKIKSKHLDEAVSEEIISKEQSVALRAFLESRADIGPTFNFTNLLYYFGGLIAIGAMIVLMNLGSERFGGWGIFCFAIVYAVVGLILSDFFRKGGHPIPAGICATFVIALVPLAIYGLQVGNGWWPDDSTYQNHQYIRWHWIYLELGTLVAGVIMLWRFRYPFMMTPIAVTLWYMSMEVAIPLMTEDLDELREFPSFFTMWFGVATIFVALWVDLRSRGSADFSFWLYIFGVITFWGGLNSQDFDGELAKFLLFSINIGLILVGAILVKNVFVIFGAFGVARYLGYLAGSVFQDSWGYPIALAAIGLLIVYCGLLWNRHHETLAARLRVLLPMPLRELVESRDYGGKLNTRKAETL